MVAENGFTNGTPREPNDSGGLGAGTLPAKKSDIRMAVRAMVGGWLDAAKSASVVRWLTDVAANSGDARARVSACDGLIKIVALAQAIDEADDKAARLDSGLPTENVRVFAVRIPEAEALEHRAHPS